LNLHIRPQAADPAEGGRNRPTNPTICLVFDAGHADVTGAALSFADPVRYAAPAKSELCAVGSGSGGVNSLPMFGGN
jgi:hypothetical protein